MLRAADVILAARLPVFDFATRRNTPSNPSFVMTRFAFATLAGVMLAARRISPGVAPRTTSFVGRRKVFT